MDGPCDNPVQRQRNAYDVVNEGCKWNRRRENTYYNKLGMGYIEEAFRYAHQLDPDTLLFYNDFNLIINNDKFENVPNMLDEFIEKDVPIDEIGFQVHINPEVSIGAMPPEEYIRKAFNAIVQRNLLLHLFEFDVVVNDESYESDTKEL